MQSQPDGFLCLPGMSDPSMDHASSGWEPLLSEDGGHAVPGSYTVEDDGEVPLSGEAKLGDEEPLLSVALFRRLRAGVVEPDLTDSVGGQLSGQPLQACL